MVPTRGSAAPRSERDNGMHKSNKFERMGQILPVTESARIEWQNVPHSMKIKNISYFTENLDYMDKMMISTIMLTFIATQNGIQRHLHAYLSSHELTFCSRRKVWFSVEKQTFHVLSNMVKGTLWYWWCRTFSSKNKHILHHDNIPALDTFRENPTDRMCPVTESAPLSPTVGVCQARILGGHWDRDLSRPRE